VNVRTIAIVVVTAVAAILLRTAVDASISARPMDMRLVVVVTAVTAILLRTAVDANFRVVVNVRTVVVVTAVAAILLRTAVDALTHNFPLCRTLRN